MGMYAYRIESGEDDAFKLYLTVGNTEHVVDYYYGAKAIEDRENNGKPMYIIEPNDIGKSNWFSNPQTTLIIHDDHIEIETQVPVNENNGNNRGIDRQDVKVPKDMLNELKKYLVTVIEGADDEMMMFPETSYSYEERRANAEAAVPQQLPNNVRSRITNLVVGNKPSSGGRRKMAHSHKRRSGRKGRRVTRRRLTRRRR